MENGTVLCKKLSYNVIKKRIGCEYRSGLELELSALAAYAEYVSVRSVRNGS